MGQTYIEINYNSAWVSESIARLSGFMWLYEWGMYIFLILTIGILFWVFYDSVTKHKDQQSLVPRILSMLGFFMIIPTFIFRFTGNADGVTNLVYLAAEDIYYPGPINWNVRWLVAGYGPIIAMVALAGVVVSIIALVIYMSSVHRAQASGTVIRNFNQIGDDISSLKNDIRDIQSKQQSASAPVTSGQGYSHGTVVDNAPLRGATIIDHRGTGYYMIVRGPQGQGRTIDLTDQDIVLGRDSEAPWGIHDMKVSGKHALLRFVNGSWVVTDMGSTNGTYVNEQRISGQQALNVGDRIRLGDTTLEFGAN